MGTVAAEGELRVNAGGTAAADRGPHPAIGGARIAAFTRPSRTVVSVVVRTGASSAEASGHEASVATVERRAGRMAADEPAAPVPVLRRDRRVLRRGGGRLRLLPERARAPADRGRRMA